VYPATEGKVDVGDCQEHERDEEGEAEDLKGVKGSVGRSEEGGRENGYESADEEDAPEDSGEVVGALEEAGATVFGERA